jgi:hypothetical protein
MTTGYGHGGLAHQQDAFGAKLVVTSCLLLVTYSLPVPWLLVTYSLPVPWLLVTYSLPVPWLLVTYSLPVPWLLVTYSLLG